MTLALSVLDQSAAVAGLTEADAIRDTLDLAPFCEALGYRRFWLSEHHGLPSIVGTAPEVLLAAVAARTSRLRIGSAGVMLTHYAALKVAEQFRVLQALAPGRVDLGVGRAPGGDMHTARALNPDAAYAAERFPEQVRDLLAWTRGERHRGIVAHPRGDGTADDAPELWMLGSSDYGARLAAELGLPYAFAYFFTDGQGVETALSLYRALYRPSARHPAPRATVCVWALAADTEDEAHHQALSRDRWRLDRARGRYGPLRPPEEIAAEGFAAAERPALEAARARAFVGDARQVATRLRELAAALDLDELVINTWACDPVVRRRSYALLAREFGMIPPGAAVTDAERGGPA